MNFWPKTSPVIDTSHWPSLTTLCVFVGHCQISPTNFREKSAKILTLPASSLRRVLPSLCKKVELCTGPWKIRYIPVETYEINSFAGMRLAAYELGMFFLCPPVVFLTKWWNIHTNLAMYTISYLLIERTFPRHLNVVLHRATGRACYETYPGSRCFMTTGSEGEGACQDTPFLNVWT